MSNGMCCLLPKNVEEFKLPNHCSLYSFHHLLFPCQCLRLVLFTCCYFSASLSRLISTTIHPSIALMPMNTINIIRIDQGDTDWVRTRTRTRRRRWWWWASNCLSAVCLMRLTRAKDDDERLSKRVAGWWLAQGTADKGMLPKRPFLLLAALPWKIRNRWSMTSWRSICTCIYSDYCYYHHHPPFSANY